MHIWVPWEGNCIEEEEEEEENLPPSIDKCIKKAGLYGKKRITRRLFKVE